jgi:uncharacterized protein
VKRALLCLAFLLIASYAPRAPAQIPLPRFDALVTDLTGTLTAQQQASLDDKLTQFQARKGAQIAVLVLPSTAPEDIAQFGIRLAESWKVGRKGTDDGLILIVAKDDRAMRFEVGYGLEGALPDALAGRIINETIAPLFKQGDFYGGINAGLDQAIRVIDGEQLPAPDQRWKPSEQRHAPWPLLIFVFLAFGGALNRFFGRVGGAGVAGLLGGGLLWWLTSRVLFGAFGFAGLFLLSLVLGGVRSATGGGSRWTSGGGGWGGFGGGGGGFGGGGGGSFGGGGASGRW